MIRLKLCFFIVILFRGGRAVGTETVAGLSGSGQCGFVYINPSSVNNLDIILIRLACIQG